MAAVSWYVYDEKLNLPQWIGLTLITAGVLMVTLFKDT
jgi:multidrug transporter EmrE-like cation transporter